MTIRFIEFFDPALAQPYVPLMVEMASLQLGRVFKESDHKLFNVVPWAHFVV